jgi:hypothetical protein
MFGRGKAVEWGVGWGSSSSGVVVVASCHVIVLVSGTVDADVVGQVVSCMNRWVVLGWQWWSLFPFRHGVVVIGHVVGVICDGCVTPEVGAGHAHACNTTLFNNRNVVDYPPIFAHISQMWAGQGGWVGGGPEREGPLMFHLSFRCATHYIQGEHHMLSCIIWGPPNAQWAPNSLIGQNCWP